MRFNVKKKIEIKKVFRYIPEMVIKINYLTLPPHKTKSKCVWPTGQCTLYCASLWNRLRWSKNLERACQRPLKIRRNIAIEYDVAACIMLYKMHACHVTCNPRFCLARLVHFWIVSTEFWDLGVRVFFFLYI
jgi:hypothetical protein